MNSFSSKIYWIIIKLARNNSIFRVIIDTTAYIFYSLFRKNKTFYFQGKKFHYFYHPYNRTIASERIVEIPLAKGIVNYFEQKNKEILEVGNVMTHYFPISHDILDKYEKGDGVINKDVVNVKLQKKYDLIFSISTMEHVGWTYGEKKDPEKFLRSIENLKKHLAKNGTLMVTFPLFYRSDLSTLIINRKMPFNKEYFMERTSFWNEWREIGFKEAIKGKSYDEYFANANVLYVGLYSNFAPRFSTVKINSSNLNTFQRIKSFYRFVHAFFEYI